jgi:predicted ArsR family transcriptional regulator
MRDLEAIALLQDPVRRSLYEDVVAQGREVSRNEAAEAAGLQRTLAAFHLDRLATAGLLEVGYRRLTPRGGPGAGRPAKLYRRAKTERTYSAPPRDYGRAARVFAEAIGRADRHSRDDHEEQDRGGID